MRYTGKFFLSFLVLILINNTMAVTISTVNGSYTDMWIFDDTTLIVVGDGGRIIKSTDGGNSWTQQSCPVVKNLTSLSFTDRQNGWIVGNNTILKTENGGENWVDCTRGLKTGDLKSVFFVNKDVGYAGGRTTGLGVESPDNFIRIDHGNVSTLNTVKDIYISSLYFSDTLVGYCVGNWDRDVRVSKTTDGGKIWNVCLALGNQLNNIYDVTSTHFINSSVGWVAGYDRSTNNAGFIIKTIDAGANWVKQAFGYNSHGFTLGEIHSIFFIDSLTGWAAGGGIYLSSNGGNSWRYVQKKINNIISKVKFLNNKVGWIVGENCCIGKSTDGGENWLSQSLGINSSITVEKICVIDSNTYFVYDGGVIKKSVNAGITWSNCDTLNGSYNSKDMIFFNKDTGWMTADNRIWKSTDGAMSFSAIDTIKNALKLCKIGDYGLLILGKNGTIYKMSSNGQFKDSITTEPKTNWQSAQCTTTKWWIVGDTNIIVSSSDSAKTFTYTTTTVPFGSRLNLKDIKFVNDSTGFAAGIKIDGLGAQSGILLKTVDGGITWNQLSTIKSAGFGSIYTFGFDTLWLQGSNCYRSIDGGTSWDSAGIGGNIAPVNGNKSLVYGMYGRIQMIDFSKTPVSIQIPHNNTFSQVKSDISLSINKQSCLKISFSLPHSDIVSVNILAINGKKIVTLFNNISYDKNQEMTYNTASLPSGAYLITVKTGKEIISKKFSVIR